MRWNASLSAALLLLTGCVSGHHGYSELGTSAAPVAGMRDMGSDPYSAPESRQQPPRLAYGGGAQDAYSAPQPEDSAPGASYSPPGERTSPPAPIALDDPSAGVQGPRGSSQPGAGEARYDEVGYAGVRGVDGAENGGAVVAVARTAAPGSVLEVTSLETGRTILVLVTGAMEADADHPLDLSPAAARQLEATSSAIPVRVRTVNPSAQDLAALRAGQAAQPRADTPPVLLNALRRHLPGAPATADTDPAPRPSYTAPSRPTRPAPTRPAATGPGYVVQVAALSNAANAQSLARSLGGFVKAGGGFYRVQMGPYRSAGEAQAARAKAAAHGYGDARVLSN
ncbi:SPOR domain-containing protein [Sphingomonas sp.]|uniref:SPOR domain-containing protein n=1 Tax=Sphingomonas sp. TaxID=28214 RepID=UPI001AFFAE86|nr:SPOR domain-containing protein [Sphingomonas sp.]MBO9711908.1 SPOR domain-containing protein [Sphingomonas sp.]